MARLLPTLRHSHNNNKDFLLHHTLAGGFQAGLPRCRLGEGGFDPPAPVFNFSKAGKEREGVGVVQRVEGLQREEGLWMPKGRTGEAGVGWFVGLTSKTFFSDTLFCLDSPIGFSPVLLAAEFLSI